MINQLEEIFSAFYVDEFKNIVDTKNVEGLNMVATDGMSHHLKEVIEELNDFEFNEWLNYHLSTCERKDLYGYSNHMLYICRKR
jgi:hypothetical protein